VTYALDLLGSGAVGLDGDVRTAGGGGVIEAFLVPALSVRVGGSVREGDVTGAQARVLVLFAAAGVALHPWRRATPSLFGAAVRADYLLMNQTVTHFVTATGAQGEQSRADVSTRARTLSGLDVVVDTEWRLGESMDLIAGGGIEETFASTYIEVNGRRVATIGPLSVVGEAGLRFKF
jgi:hypothetical protein